jgi:hypothetical protein
MCSWERNAKLHPACWYRILVQMFFFWNFAIQLCKLILHKSNEQVGLSSNASDLYLGGTQFKPWQGYNYDMLLWFSLVSRQMP